MVIPILIWCVRNNRQSLAKENGRLRNKRKSGDHRNYSIIKIGQNTEKIPGDLRRIAITQSLLENHQLTLV